MNKIGGLILSNFKTYYKTVIKKVWCWHKNRHVIQCKLTVGPEIDTQAPCQWISTKMSRQLNGEMIVLSTNWARKMGQPYFVKQKPQPFSDII